MKERMKRTAPLRSQVDEQFAARRERNNQKRANEAQRDSNRRTKREF